MKGLACTVMSVLLMAAVPAFAAGGNIQHGKKLSKQCEACHGKGGHSHTPQFPILAGQYDSYLVHALKQYRSGARKNVIMNGMAASLSDQDIHDLAAFFASRKTSLYTPSIHN